MRFENVRQSAISLGCFVQIAAAQDYALLGDPFHHLIVSNESFRANPLAAHLDETPLCRRPRHDPARAVYGGEKRFARKGRIDPFNDDGVIAHASADETFLSGKRRRRALPHDPVMLAVMFLPPRKVVMVVNLFLDVRAQDSVTDVARGGFAARVSVSARQRPG